MYIFQSIKKKLHWILLSKPLPVSITYIPLLWSMAAALSHGGGLFISGHGGGDLRLAGVIETRAGHFLMRNRSWMPDLTRQQRLISATATLSQFNKVLSIFEPSIHFLKPWTWWAILGLSAVSRGPAGTNPWGLKGWSRKYALIWAPMSKLHIHRSNKSGSCKVFTQLSC